ncbi:MAG: hypothetical protein R3C28_31730 [Pirellulaceae bacterium]
MMKSINPFCFFPTLASLFPVLFAVTGLTIATASVQAQVFPPDAIVEGKNLTDWVAEIHNWEWWYVDQGLSDEEARNVPPSGLAAANNDGSVYFRAGYFFPLDLPINDSFLVPADRPILQRALDFAWDIAPQDLDARGLPSALTGDPMVDFGQPDPDALLAELALLNDEFVEDLDGAGPLVAEIGGELFTQERLAAQRVSFQSTVTIGNNPWEIPPGDWLQVVDGFWFMLEPLAPGEQITVRLGRNDANGNFVPDLTNTFTAVPEPNSHALIIAAATFACLFMRRPRTCSRHRRTSIN